MLGGRRLAQQERGGARTQRQHDETRKEQLHPSAIIVKKHKRRKGRTLCASALCVLCCLCVLLLHHDLDLLWCTGLERVAGDGAKHVLAGLGEGGGYGPLVAFGFSGSGEGHLSGSAPDDPVDGRPLRSLLSLTAAGRRPWRGLSSTGACDLRHVDRRLD